MTNEDVAELERRCEDLRTQLVRLKTCVRRIQIEADFAELDCAEIENTLKETQTLLDRASSK